MCGTPYKLLRVLFGCQLAAMTVGLAPAAEAPNPAADVAMVRPMIGETTALVIKVDPARLAPADLVRVLESAAPAGDETRLRSAETVRKGIEAFRAATGGQVVYATIGIPLSKSERPVFVFLKQAPGVDRSMLTGHLAAAGQGAASVVRNGVVVFLFGRETDATASLDALVPSERKEVDDAFHAVAQYPIQVLLLPPDYVRRTVAELMPQLPRQLGGGPSEVLTEGLLWGAFGCDPAQLRAELVLQSASPEAARRLAEHLPKMLQAVYNAVPELQRRAPRATFQSLLASFVPKVENDRVILRVDKLEPSGGGLRLAAIAAAAIQDRVNRGANVEKFKQILLAMHNHHDVYQMFPPHAKDRDSRGTIGLSWRVFLLPFLGESKLYQEFHLNEPWDSPHNKGLIARMPKVYQARWLGIPPGRTTFLAPVGEDTVFGSPKPTRIQDITDGTVNTAVLVEVKPELAVPWTAPQDYAFDPAAPGRGLHVLDDGRFLAGIADGSVHQLRADVKPDLLLELFRKSDGRPLDWNALH